jgi:hypothetical protein
MTLRRKASQAVDSFEFFLDTHVVLLFFLGRLRISSNEALKNLTKHFSGIGRNSDGQAWSVSMFCFLSSY